MNKRNSKKKAFTMIELLVVLSVVGILILLAMSKFLGYVDKSRMANVKHDVKLAEYALSEFLMKNENLPEEWIDVSANDLNKLALKQELYDKGGYTSSVGSGKYKEIDRDFLIKHIRTRLGGKFYSDEKGLKVYYEDDQSSEVDYDEDLFDRDIEENEVSKKEIEVLNYKFPNGVYRDEDIIGGYVEVEGIQAGDYHIEANYHYSKMNDYAISDSVSFNIKKNENKTIRFNSIVKPEYLRGFYDFELKVKDSNDELLMSYYVDNSVNLVGSEWIYYYEEDFTEIDRPVMGGIGSLSSDRIKYSYVKDDELSIDYDSITFNVQPESNKSGQMKTVLPETYGTYEAKIKVPNSKALLNGFFLYGHNESRDGVEHEIDIEILHYEDKWQVWGTVFNETHDEYAQGEEPGVIFQSKLDLDFDPSEDYHYYKIDFYDDYVSFSVDGVEFGNWQNKFDYGDMHLYAGNFYTHWLTGNLSKESLDMNVQWIRKKYSK